jgi:hypothetical protein
MAIDPITGGLIGQGIGALFGAFGAGKRRRAAADLRRAQEAKIARLEASRQDIIDPFSSVKDLSSMVTNPFANLQVATQAAEMKAEQADISLASTLDVLRATGTGAGGATALAQAAARSKQDIAASIEQQEAKNALLRAQGEQSMQQLRMREMQRLQQAEVSGRQFVFGQQELREMQALDRAQAMLEGASGREQMAIQAQQSAFGQLAGIGASLGAQALGNRRLADPIELPTITGLQSFGTIEPTANMINIPRYTVGGD